MQVKQVLVVSSAAAKQPFQVLQDPTREYRDDTFIILHGRKGIMTLNNTY
jgi:hypothetical protein